MLGRRVLDAAVALTLCLLSLSALPSGARSYALAGDVTVLREGSVECDAGWQRLGDWCLTPVPRAVGVSRYTEGLAYCQLYGAQLLYLGTDTFCLLAGSDNIDRVEMDKRSHSVYNRLPWKRIMGNVGL